MRCKVCGKFYLFRHRCEKLRQNYVSEVERYATRPSDSDMLDPTGLIIAASVISNVLDDDGEANRILNNDNPPQEQEQKFEMAHDVINPAVEGHFNREPEPVEPPTIEERHSVEPTFNSEPSFTSEPSFSSDSFDSGGGGCDSGGCGGSD